MGRASPLMTAPSTIGGSMHLKHLKVLCLAICVLTGVMAINASASQAEWLVLRNKVSVSSIEVTTATEGGRLLVPNLGVTIHCSSGTGSAKASLWLGSALFLANGTLVFSGCQVGEFEEVCSVRGSKDAVGSNKITTNGEGSASMTGSEVFLTASSTKAAPFATVVFEGAECPFIEIDGRTFGSVTFRVNNPLEDNAKHTFSITSQNLTFGASPAKIEGFFGNLAGSATDVGGQTLAVHLRHLSGCFEIC